MPVSDPGMGSGVKESFGGGSSGKTKVVADLTGAYKDLNTEMGKTKSLSADIKSTLDSTRAPSISSSSGSKSSFKPSSSSMDNSSSSGDDGGPDGGDNTSGGGGSSGSTISSKRRRKFKSSMLSATTQGVDTEDYITNDIARNRFGFFGGKFGDPEWGVNAFKRMMRNGTPIAPLDAAFAAMTGIGAGLGPGLANYGTIMNSVSSLSNLVPGAGLTESMGGVAALNQGASVNKLRMIGINVRDQNGYMRNIEDIARDLWNTLNTNKSGTSRITQRDLAYSLQPGNSVDMLLNQYFGNDEVLRDGIVSYLFQFAGSSYKGPYYGEQTTGRLELEATGATPGVVSNIARRQAATYNLQNANTSAGILGLSRANESISFVADLFASLDAVHRIAVDTYVGASAYFQTVAGAGKGAGGSIIATALGDPEATKKMGETDFGKTMKYVIAEIMAVGAIEKFFRDIRGERAVPEFTPYGDDTTDYVDPTASGSSSGGSSGTSGGGGTSGGNSGGTSSLRPKKPVAKYKMTGETAVGWAKKLLTRLGKPQTKANIAAIVGWMMHENTGSSGWLGERNNPLNTKFTTGKEVGVDEYGINVYATEAEGIDAVAQTLQLKGHGYENILSSLDSYTSTEAQTWSKIVGSDWAAGHYGATSTDKQVTFHGTTVNINLPAGSANDPDAIAAAVYNALKTQAHVDAGRGGR